MLGHMIICLVALEDSDQGVAKMAMEAMVKELKESTSSMTSVPKPLKFLRPHYSTLTEHYAKVGSAVFCRNR